MIKIAHKTGYSSVIVLNSFAYVDGNSNTAKEKSGSFTDVNFKVIEKVIGINKNFLLAWGTKIGKEEKRKILNLFRKKE